VLVPYAVALVSRAPYMTVLKECLAAMLPSLCDHTVPLAPYLVLPSFLFFSFVIHFFNVKAARMAELSFVPLPPPGTVSVTFNPEERADEMKKFGGFIPGIRPGKPTADYLSYVLNRITLPGSIYLGVIAVLPNLFLQIGNSGSVQNLPFGGTAVLIMIGVGLDTVKQIESQLMQRNYEGFLK
jgi:hypothetical protein